MSEILNRFANLSPEQRKLLLKKMQERGLAPQQRPDVPETPPLVPLPRDGNPSQGLPLSFAQQRLWFIDQWEPGSVAYNIFSAVRLSGRLDLAALERSLNEVVRRHEVLRTTFTAVAGRPAQIIAPTLRLALPLLDLSGVPEGERETEAQRLAAQEARWSFDLVRGPLLRCCLLRLDAEAYMLLVNMHHIISDGWSSGVFIEEMATLYSAFSARQPSPLAPLPLQYADFAAWQRGWLQGELLEQQLSYWTRQLRDAPTLLDLPADHPRPAAQTFRGAMQTFRLPAPLTEALRALGRAEECTLFMTLLAAFNVLLQRYSGQADILVGTPIANRRWEELEGLIGFFVNTLVVRSDLSGTPTFRELLGRVREVMLGVYAHQDLPFEMLVEALQLPRDLSRNPLFQVLFVLQNAPLKRLKLPALTLTPLAMDAGAAMFDLTLAMAEVDDFVYGEFQYNTDLFETSTIARMTGHFQTLLEGIVADSAHQLWQLPLLTAAERQQLLVAWNTTQATYTHERCLHELIEDQVARTPDVVAVVFDRSGSRDRGPGIGDREPTPIPNPQCLTYQALNARANQLAHYLQLLGVGPDVRVGVAMERSLDRVVALYATLLAGGAYVPLDPSYPSERLAFMLEDAQAPVLLTTTDHRPPTTDLGLGNGDWGVGKQSNSQSPIPNPQSSILVYLDANWPTIAGAPATSPALQLLPDHAAYVIYTSGSTGRPKGVVVSHQALLNLIAWHQHTFDVQPHDRATQLAGVAFDASVWELWPYLTAGASIHLPNAEIAHSPVQLRDWLLEQAITLCFLPTPLAERLLPLDWPPHAALRILLTGGDTLQRYPPPALPFTLVNNYGPTENTVVSTSTCVLPLERPEREPPIGRPIRNTQLYLLDRHMQPVPVGVPGEIYIGGVQLARGYLNRPDLTAERFLPNPFAIGDWGPGTGDWGTKDAPNPQSPIPNPRLYKTGDLARYRPDGAIEYLGRIDHQVKVRGYRIELGEIETVLSQHPSVRDCVVVAQADGSGDKRLVAYIVQGSGVRGQGSEDAALIPDPRSLTPELRTFLKHKLPEYMLPSLVVELDALPLTPNGKVDRRALPAPDHDRPALETAFVAPRTPIEKLLADIWAEVLGRGQVGIHDNFFESGGHSLVATELMANIRATFGVELSLRSVFEAPTVAELAALVLAQQQSASGLLIPSLRPQPRGGPLPLSFAQQRLWFLDRLTSAAANYLISVPLHLTGLLDLRALTQSFAALVTRHETLRTTLALLDGQAVQLIGPPTPPRITLLDLRALAAELRAAASQHLASADAQQPFDLTRGPLLRLHLLRLDATEHVLLLTMHHIITDGWSLDVLVRELTTLYAGFSSGQALSLPELPIQYADYALWQRDRLRGEVLEQLLAYWRGQLAAAPTALELPTDRPRPALQSFRGATLSLHLLPPLTAALLELSREAGATLFMTLLAAFSVLLARYSGQDDIVVGTPIAGRTHAETKGLIGSFVNTLVLRLGLADNPPFRELLRQAREVCLEAYAHQELPFELLVEALQLPRDLSRHPLFQVVLVLQNAPLRPLTLPKLTFRPLAVETYAAKFDLTLTLTETEEGLTGDVEYATDLFDAATIERLAGHFQVLLEGIVAAPERRLAELPLVSAAERQQLLLEWNATQSDYPREVAITQVFEAQVARTPDAVAIVYAGSGDWGLGTGDWETARTPNPQSLIPNPQLTYRELNKRANHLAHHLRALGVGPEVVVALCMQRSLDLVIALLGILKAGGAYLALDPTSPQERLAFLIADAGAPVLLTHAPLLDVLPATWAMVIALDSDWPSIAQERDHNPPAVAAADNLIYVSYTSGSTGTPKGVRVVHRAVMRLVKATNFASLTENEVFLQLAPIAFDASTLELWGSLLNGGRLVIFPARTPEPTELAQVLEQERVTILWLTAGFFHQMVEQQLDSLQRVPQLLAGGDVLSVSHVRTLLHARTQGCLINGYGPTENTTFTCCYPMTVAAQVGFSIPIGRPIANTTVYLLDSQLQPVPIGVAGELYIGGDGLARDYLNRPELTAERFIPNPFARVAGDGCWVLEEATPNTQHPTPNTRLYRTGDLVRYRADGVIEFLGRRDQQVKVRGYRIELGEIETVLSQHPSVRECVVLAPADGSGDKRLVAYVVPSREQGTGDRGQEGIASDTASLSPVTSHLSPQELRTFLKHKLPDYMVPSLVVELDALPLTPNGKVDRRALPAPDHDRPALETAFVAPRTPIEKLLANIWAEVLGLEQVGIHDNFFDVGGDSIRSLRVLALARERGLSISLPQLFQRQTIAALAEDAAATPDAADVAVAPFSLISAADRQQLPADIEDAYPLAGLQAGMVFHSAYSPERAIYHDVASFHLRAPFDPAAFQAALRQLAARHPILRTSFDLDQFSEPLQLVHQQVTIPAPIDDLRVFTPTEQEAELARSFEAEQRRKFVWTEAPLLRFHLHRRSQQSFQLTLSFHHAILDGWSLASMLTELFQLYLAQLGADLPPLPPPPALAFRDFVAAERRMSASEEARRYWMERLRDHTMLHVPRWPAPTRPTGPRTAHARNVLLADDVADGIKQAARLAGVPLKSVLLAAHLRVLSRYSGQTDILTGLTTNGRPESRDGERVLGLFLNTVPLRLQVAGGSWLDLVRATFAAEQELLRFRQYPLIEIQQALGGQALFETSFNFVHFHVYQGMLEMKVVELLDSKLFQETNFTLMTDFSLDPATAQIELRLEYDPAELCDEQIAALMNHYMCALTALAHTPQQRYEQLVLLTPQEQHQLLVTWNAAASAPPHDRCIHELVAAQAMRTPDAIAVLYAETGNRGQGSGVRDQEAPTLRPQSSVLSPEQLTYRELNRRANRLAHRLRVLGIGPEARVACCMERSAQLLIGLLGILKAGGVYVPLDPAHPPARLAFMLADAQPALLLTQRHLVERMSAIDRRPTTDDDMGSQSKIQNPKLALSAANGSNIQNPIVVYLVNDDALPAGYPATDPAISTWAEQVAYMIYTSGSTGMPKGVLIPHRALVNHSTAVAQRYDLRPGDRVLQFAAPGFDVFLEEVLPSWLNGATVVLQPDRGAAPLTDLLAFVEREGLTVLNLPAPYWHEWVALLPHITQPIPATLRMVVVGSESVLAERLAIWHTYAGDHVRWCNAYGLTEATITTLLYEPADRRSYSLTRQVPIGRAIARAQIYLLDHQLNPVPIGVPGELFIGGDGLARGYLNRPDLTAERFVPNPFAQGMGDKHSAGDGLGWGTEDPIPNTQHPTPSTRLYRTGDLARYLPDGNIEFLGRLDDQVKIRSFRIEPGEIEAVLHQHLAVREAVVVAREDVPGEKRLVAYVVPSREQGTGDRGQEGIASDSPSLSPMTYHLSPQELRDFLKDKLPDYMVPTAFILLDALPLTPSGKIDRRALPPPGGKSIERERPFVAPRDTLELQLVQIWEAILQVQPISITDDFFTLGGHSLSAMRVVDQIKRRIGGPLALSDLFQAPTIEQLASLLRRQPSSQRRSPLVPIQPKGSKQPFFCVHPVGGGVICYVELSRHLGMDQPFYGLEAIGLDQDQPVQTRIEEMAVTYIAALQAVRPHGPYFLGGWSFGGVVALEMAQQLQQQGHEVALLALFDSWAPGMYTGSGEQSDATLLLQFIEDIGGISGKDMRTLSDRLAHDVADDPLRYIAERAGDERLFPLGIDDAYVLRLFEVYKSNYRALSRYQARPYAIPTFLFRACEEIAQNPHDITLGWDQLSADPVEVRTVPGDHYSMLTRPHVQHLAEQLKACLESKQLHGPATLDPKQESLFKRR